MVRWRGASAYRSLHLWSSHQPEARLKRLALARRAYETACAAPAATRLRLIAERGLIVDLLENQQIEEYARRSTSTKPPRSELGSPAEIYWAMALRAAEATMHGDLEIADQLAAEPSCADTNSTRSQTARTFSNASSSAISKRGSPRRFRLSKPSAPQAPSIGLEPRSMPSVCANRTHRTSAGNHANRFSVTTQLVSPRMRFGWPGCRSSPESLQAQETARSSTPCNPNSNHALTT